MSFDVNDLRYMANCAVLDIQRGRTVLTAEPTTAIASGKLLGLLGEIDRLYRQLDRYATVGGILESLLGGGITLDAARNFAPAQIAIARDPHFKPEAQHGA
jgi:hypothetical protein